MGDRWNFEKLGLTYRCWNDDIQTEFRLSHIKRKNGDLIGELSIRTNFTGVKTRKGVLHVGRLNVLSSSTRAGLVRMLEKRTPGLDMDWFDGLEWLCQSVILAEQEGEPVSAVGHDPISKPGQQYMVEPLIMKGRPALLFGPGGVGKSLVALTCALSVASGREIIPGVAPAVHGPVLYLDWETTREVINDRIQAIALGHHFKPGDMYYRHCIRPLADDAEELSELVASKGIVLVIVDSAAYAMGSQGEYGDANESVLRMHEGLRIIGVTSQIVDHVNKTEARSKNGTATPYGSAYKTWAARISWEVRKTPSETGLAINLYHAKSNDTPPLDPIALDLEWNHDGITFHQGSIAVEAPPEPTGDDTAEVIRELLHDGEEMTIGTIASTLTTGSRKENTVRTTVYRMHKRGELNKTERGGYRLSTAPLKFRTSSRDGDE